MMFTRLAAAASIAVAVTAAQASPGFIDPTMDPANYSAVIYDTEPTVQIAVQASASGDPGPSLLVHYTNSGGPVDNLASFVGVIYNGFSYDPSTQGALASVDFSSARYVDVGALLNPSINTVSRPLIEQGGNFYFASVPDQQLRGQWFTTSASGLAAGQFVEFDFTSGLSDGSHPDFSSAGASLLFGLTTRFVLGTGGAPIALDGQFGYDNLSFALNPAAVPEPQTYALMLAGLAALAWSRRRLAPAAPR